jgi:hypothetical protein
MPVLHGAHNANPHKMVREIKLAVCVYIRDNSQKNLACIKVPDIFQFQSWIPHFFAFMRGANESRLQVPALDPEVYEFHEFQFAKPSLQIVTLPVNELTRIAYT